jgi:uncharacterized protein
VVEVAEPGRTEVCGPDAAYVFWTFLLAAWTLLHFYVLLRAASVPFVARHLSRRALYLVGGALWATVFVLPFAGHQVTGALARWVELTAMSWLASLFLVATCLLAVDLVTCFGLVLRHRAPTLRGWGLIAGAALTLIAIVQGVRPPVVRSSEVTLPGLPADADGTVVVAISDLHLGNLLGADWLGARVEQIETLHPDVLVLLGDIVEGHGADEGSLQPVLRRLTAPLGVLAVTGNHEWHGGRGAGPGILDRAGLTTLHDRWVAVRPGLVVAGVDDLDVRHDLGSPGGYVRRALEGRPPGATVLLSHSPLQVSTAASLGVGLMLAAHTHGGQIWPFDLIVRLSYRYIAGRYDVDGMPLIVCRGTGTWGPRMRLWLPSEILKITLRSGPPAPSARPRQP